MSPARAGQPAAGFEVTVVVVVVGKQSPGMPERPLPAAAGRLVDAVVAVDVVMVVVVDVFVVVAVD